jgi:predicted O-methyltransferase YrrM
LPCHFGGPLRRSVIATREDSWQFAEDYIGDDDVTVGARARSVDLRIESASTGAGAALRFLAALVGAKNVVEVGTGTGVSGLWLLRGMDRDGVLTSVDIEGEHLRQAREAFSDAGIAPQRTRLITGRALDVLPRLADGAYDMVVIDGPPDEFALSLEEAVRLLRPHGLVVILGILADGSIADPARRDPETLARRTLATAMRDDERLVPVLLPVGGGVLAAVVN